MRPGLNGLNDRMRRWVVAALVVGFAGGLIAMHAVDAWKLREVKKQLDQIRTDSVEIHKMWAECNKRRQR